MKLEDFFKPIDFTGESIRAWATVIGNPSGICKAILQEPTDSLDAVLRALKIWFVGIFITIIFAQGSAYRLYEIDPFSINFCASIGLIMLIGLLVMVTSVHFAFLVFRVRASFRDTFISFLVFTSIFFPLIGIFSTPVLIAILEILKIVKTPGVDLSLWLNILEMAETNNPNWRIWGYLQLLTSSLLSYLLAWQTSLILDFLSERWGVERIRVFNAGTFGITLGGFFSFLVAIMYLFTLYTFIGK
ncbi:hypothetical protein [Nitrosospira sp. Nsp13]|uniref:hypothetical protein n=1 Tax=Nitrosospira sp. Nsp13 TaxID=1855332 RepID=UPI00088EE1B4|nr:hypothetical protein [Nitrosospira sp. Nsp13]SCX76906.1 hypothetical protein SAMN05216308_10173 [Nitrosospira sp. Nsp13]